jgi:CRP/FNR family transcriptional regulator, cyclic AMP receptor protein
LQDIKPREEHPAFYAALYEFIARITAGRLESTTRRMAELELEVRRLKELLARSKSRPQKSTARSRPVVAKRKPARRVKR